MTERIDHAAEADLCIKYARGSDSAQWAQLSMLQAQVHATLALVEQQRIANLIAWGEQNPMAGMFAKGTALGDEIRSGLGL